MNSRQQLIGLLRRRAYREGDFVLSSGRHSDFYLDAKQVTYHPDGAPLVGAAVLDIIAPYGVDAVGGLTMGADAIVTSVVYASRQAARPIPGFVVRKEAKGHGTQKWVEGVLPPNARVAIVDDVITSGQSALRAVEAVKSAGGSVVVVVTLVDREEGGRERIEAEGLDFRPVCTLSEIRGAAG